jgi:hypothetical protein
LDQNSLVRPNDTAHLTFPEPFPRALPLSPCRVGPACRARLQPPPPPLPHWNRPLAPLSPHSPEPERTQRLHLIIPLLLLSSLVLFPFRNTVKRTESPTGVRGNRRGNSLISMSHWYPVSSLWSHPLSLAPAPPLIPSILAIAQRIRRFVHHPKTTASITALVGSPLLYWTQSSTLVPSPGSLSSSARHALPHHHRQLAGAHRRPIPEPHLVVGDRNPNFPGEPLSPAVSVRWI